MSYISWQRRRERRRKAENDDGAFALASCLRLKDSSGYCRVPLPHRRCLSPVLTSVQGVALLFRCIRSTNNHPHSYIDSTTVLSDNSVCSLFDLQPYICVTHWSSHRSTAFGQHLCFAAVHVIAATFFFYAILIHADWVLASVYIYSFLSIHRLTIACQDCHNTRLPST